MRLGIIGKDKPERVFIAVRNAESSADLAQGVPVCFIMNGTNDGNDVINATTGAAARAHTLFAGVITGIDGIANGKYGVAQVFGFCGTAKLTVRTRAATSDSFSTVASIGSAGNLCLIETVNGNFATNATGAASEWLGYAIMAETRASVAGAATATSLSLTVSTALTKLFLRAM